MSLPETIAPALSGALAARGYNTLTAVQNAVLAPETLDSDLLVSAQTGSGKTVAFGSPWPTPFWKTSFASANRVHRLP
ncbi:DEAD/DEAH box helicase [Ochrobactrum haematophilum]|uniref:DEAD/DEAH box helicase n=1 Tax=Brucella haematophila TaxID=419474 RepID=A0ABX1DK90_9HYPH|nr:DEAD/DEAH box helicase [Brucella haematophila]